MNKPIVNQKHSENYRSRTLRTILTGRTHLVLLMGITLALIPLLSLLAAEGDNQHEVVVHLDNDHIQTFRGRLGRWVVPGGESYGSLAYRFGTTVEEIRAINDGTLDRSRYNFVPMSLDYYNQLVQEGYGRRMLRIDERNMLWPVERPHYTSRYGNRRGGMHLGVDLACSPNTVVLAAGDGVISHSAWYGGLGQAVAIQHDDGLVTWYGHNNQLLVKVGERVRRGQIIAFSGNTGRSTGPHVHFEVRYMNVALNPEDFLEQGLIQPNLVLQEESPLDPELGTNMGASALLGQDEQTPTP
ncbi:MAG: M23 family metallopeptidase [Leptospiraceae bacterium]|nr:M23 family metallopeptidase [Leptospiraceae bacterium]